MTEIHINALLHTSPAGGVERTVEGCVGGLLGSGAGRALRVHGTRSLSQACAHELVSEPAPFICHEYGSRAHRIFLEQGAVLRAGRQVLWHHLGYVAPWVSPSPYLVSIYDVTALRFPRFCRWENRLFYRLMLPHTIRHARMILVPSTYVADQIRLLWPEAAARMEVLPLPLHPGIRRAAEAADAGIGGVRERKQVLYLGDLSPRKNLLFALRSYAALPDSVRKQYPFVVCGKGGNPGKEALLRLAERLGIRADVDVRPYMEEERVPDLIRSSALLLYPSLEEGYGYPPLEAMALGTPALVSDRGALPEVAGKRGAVVCPLDVAEFGGRMRRILTDADRYQDLVQRGREAMLRDTWKDYAGTLLQIYSTVKP